MFSFLQLIRDMLNALGKEEFRGVLHETVCDAGTALVQSQNSPLGRIDQQVKPDPLRKHSPWLFTL